MNSLLDSLGYPKCLSWHNPSLTAGLHPPKEQEGYSTVQELYET